MCNPLKIGGKIMRNISLKINLKDKGINTQLEDIFPPGKSCF